MLPVAHAGAQAQAPPLLPSPPAGSIPDYEQPRVLAGSEVPSHIPVQDLPHEALNLFPLPDPVIQVLDM